MIFQLRDAVYSFINEEFHKSNYISAELFAELYFKLCSGDSSSNMILGQIYLSQGKLASAEAAFSRSEVSRSSYFRALTLFYLERFCEALELVSLTIKLYDQFDNYRQDYLITYPNLEELNILYENIKKSVESYKICKILKIYQKQHRFGVVNGEYFK